MHEFRPQLILVLKLHRCIQIIDIKAHRRTERSCVQLELYGHILSCWARLALPLDIFGASAAVVGTMIVILKYGGSGLPLIVYLLYPMVGAIIGFNLFLLLYAAVYAKKVTEGVIMQLLASTEELRHCGERAKQTTAGLVRRAQALRPVTLSAGGFTNVSFGLMCDVLDEIISQIVFLFLL